MTNFHDYPDRADRAAAHADGNRVAFEVLLRDTQAARLRLMSGLLEARGAFTQFYKLHDALCAIVWLAPERHALFVEKCKPFECRYRSPTRFDNGTLIPLFDSPEHELRERRAKLEAEQALRTLGQ